MRHGGKPVQTHLRGRTLHRVHRAEQAINFVRVRMSFEREQAFGDGLQMLFGFGNEEFENFVGNFAILRKRDRQAKRPGKPPEWARPRPAIRRPRSIGVSGSRRGRKCERVALLESCDVVDVSAPLELICRRSNSSTEIASDNEFRERAVHVRSERRVHGVVKDVRHLRGHFGKLREAVARGSARKRVRSDVKLLEVLGLGLRLLQKAGVLPQILEVFGSLLEEQLDGFLVGPVHRAPSTRAGARRASTAPGLR